MPNALEYLSLLVPTGKEITDHFRIGNLVRHQTRTDKLIMY